MLKQGQFTRKTSARFVMSIVLAVTLIFGMMHPQSAYAEHHEYSTEDILQVIEGALGWTRTSQGVEPGGDVLVSDEFKQYAGTSPIDWFAFSAGRLGYPGNYESYLAALEAYVTDKYATDTKLDTLKATEWHRIGLTVLALGGDPTAFGTDPAGNPINLVADGTYTRGETVPLSEQGLNGYVFALIMLTSLDFQVPEGSFDDVESIIIGVLKEEREGGGFSMSTSRESSPDITAMALQALAPYYNDEKTYTYTQTQSEAEVTKTVGEVIDEALTFLSEQQAPGGGFGSRENFDAESTAQVLIALSALGVDINTDERFIKEGNTVLDGLMSLRNDDGGFAHIVEENGVLGPSQAMATDQALRALVAVALQAEGMNTLYDLRPDEGPALYSLMNAAGDAAAMAGTDGPSVPSSSNNSGGTDPLAIVAIILVVVAVVSVALVVAALFCKRKKK